LKERERGKQLFFHPPCGVGRRRFARAERLRIIEVRVTAQRAGLDSAIAAALAIAGEISRSHDQPPHAVAIKKLGQMLCPTDPESADALIHVNVPVNNVGQYDCPRVHG
jgi:hypothetical protein